MSLDLTKTFLATCQSIIRRYKKGDEYDIAKLMKLLFGRYHWLENWRWRQTNPVGRNIIWVAECNGKIVGHITRVPVPMKIGKENLKGSIVIDAATHPNFRRQGIFKELMDASWTEAVRDGIVVSFGDASKTLMHARKHSRTIRHINIDVAKIASMVMPLNLHTMIKKRLGQPLLAKATSYGIEFALKLSTFVRKKVEVDGLEIRQIHAFDDRIDDFWKTISRFYEIIVVRDKEYLNWKYFKRPHLSFDVFLAEIGEKIVGYIVLSTRDQEGFIVDLMANPTRTDVIQCLVSMATQHFEKTKAAYATCWMLKGNPCYKVLLREGFIPFPSRWTLVARVDSSKVSEAFTKEAKNWYITRGDFV